MIGGEEKDDQDETSREDEGGDHLLVAGAVRTARKKWQRHCFHDLSSTELEPLDLAEILVFNVRNSTEPRKSQ